MYAFFRARTLGYDVYPEDYFLRNFPWQQYGGLWIVNEARFARAEPIDALAAQALRRITGEGASPQSGDSWSPISQFTNSSFQHRPAMPVDPQNNTWCQYPAISSFDGSGSMLTYEGNQPVFNMGGLNAVLSQSEASRPDLTLLTDVGRRYPGFPSPLSPTLSAKELYPTPTSDVGRAAAPRVQSPTVRSVSPMSIDGSNMCGPSARCMSHSYEHFAGQMGLIDSVVARSTSRCELRSPSRAPSTSPLSPTSPTRALSPRVGMLRNMATKQGHRSTSRSPAVSPDKALQNSASTIGVRRDSACGLNSPASSLCSQCIHSLSPRLAPSQATPPVLPSIQIANGTEFEIGSPISPTGTMLSYTSNRTVDSGLLAVPALSEPQVAEYRFWVPCGRRVCAFGCGGAQEGKNAAAKRLFRGEEHVGVIVDEIEGSEYDCGEAGSLVDAQHMRFAEKKGPQNKPVGEWETFLRMRDRDVSVARV